MMKVLISGIGGPTPIGIAKSLRLKYSTDKITIVGIDGNKFAPGLYNKTLFDKTFLVPHSHDEKYWGIIDALIKQEEIDHAFIIPETEVLVWSERQKEGKLPCKALIPQYDVAQAFYDKHKTFELLKSTDLVPRSIKLERDTELEDIGRELGYPYWIRGASGAGAIGAYKIKEVNDLQNWLNINPRIDDFLASVYLPGRNFACKLLFLEGDLIRSASGERVDYLLSSAAPSGISGMCARGNLINNENLVKKSELAIRTIFRNYRCPVHGMFTVDFKENAHGEPKITEINIRHVSFSLAFSLGGANFAADYLEASTSENFDRKYHMYTFDQGQTFIRGVDSELFLINDSELKDVDTNLI